MGEETRGRPSRAETRANNVVQRIQAAYAAEDEARRPLPYAQRLFHERDLTPTQLTAVDQIGKLYRQWAKQNGARFNPKSQSFEFTTAGEMERILSTEEQERINEVNEAWHRLEKCVPVYPREAWAWVIELCVIEAYVPRYVLHDVKVVLDRVADEFGLGAAVEEALTDAGTQRVRRRQVRFRTNTPVIVPAIKPTLARPRPKAKTRGERFEAAEYAAAPKHPRPSQLTEKEAVAAARDREGLERMLLGRAAQREEVSA